MKLQLLLIASFCSTMLWGQIPEGYYSTAESKTGYELKTVLLNIIDNHTAKGYSAIWGFVSSNDLDIYYEKDNTILDMYSENPSGADPYTFTKSTDQCGSYSGEGSCYNREHSFPKSWFGGSIEPMYSDIHHIFPTDGKVNSMRGNYPFGIVGSATSISENGSKVGAASAETGYSGTVFEPIDEFKGDFARAHFYMVTRYEDKVASWQSNTVVLDGSANKAFKDWAVNLLLDWHRNDPVSQKEIDRNNAAYLYQGNRNPYVDHPEYVECIWGDTCTEPDTTIPTLPGNEVNCTERLFPGSTDNPIWSEVHWKTSSLNSTDTVFEPVIYSSIGDTVIQGVEYDKLYKLSSKIISSVGSELIGAIRADDCGKVFFHRNNEESVLYDFSAQAGDTVNLSGSSVESALLETVNEYILLDNSHVDRYSFPDQSLGDWINGIGSVDGLLSNFYTTEQEEGSSGAYLQCYIQGVEVVYHQNNSLGCFPKFEPTSEIITSVKSKVVLFPQPAKDVLYFENIQNKGVIQLHSLTGELILSMKVSTSKLSMPLSGVKPGTYIVRMAGDDGFYFSKLVVVQ